MEDTVKTTINVGSKFLNRVDNYVGMNLRFRSRSEALQHFATIGLDKEEAKRK